jgi:hypothetical protein
VPTRPDPVPGAHQATQAAPLAEQAGFPKEGASDPARIRLEVPRETVVVVADTQRAVDNIIEALRGDGMYEDHAVISDGSLGDHRMRSDWGGWISGPCLNVGEPE